MGGSVGVFSPDRLRITLMVVYYAGDSTILKMRYI